MLNCHGVAATFALVAGVMVLADKSGAAFVLVVAAVAIEAVEALRRMAG